MPHEDIIKQISHYLERFPNINSEAVIEGLSLIHNYRQVNLLAEMLFAKQGFNRSQLEILEAVFHHKGTLTPAQLADEVHLARSTMTGILDSLELKGYISRSIFKGDRRMKTIILTDKGIRCCEELLPVRYNDIVKITEILSSDERHILIKVYNKMTSFLEKALDEGTIASAKTNPSSAA